jgi:hypothetical protein
MQIFIGYEPREDEAYRACVRSIQHRWHTVVRITPLILDQLRARGLYRRPTSIRDGKLWDDISEAGMSTEFAISRFLVPYLAGSGYAIFMDCDIMARVDIADIIDHVEPRHAVTCVKHNFAPPDGVKMDGQLQQLYLRKNWSSVMVFNCSHPSNKRLTVDMVNTVPGRDLHRFAWLDDDEIGALPAEWNYLVGHTELSDGVEPKLVHWTEGSPCMPGFENAPFADEYRDELL